MDAIRSIGAIAAHRGWHQDGAPENGIAALDAASRGGADWVELDIRRLGDGTLVVHHDSTLAGTPLAQLDRSALARHPEVPTLDAWASRAGRSGIGVLAEFKEPGYEREALRQLRGGIGSSPLVVMGFDHDVVRSLADLAPDVPVGMLTDVGRAEARSVEELVGAARSTGATFVGLNRRQATEPVLAAVHDAGLGAAVWTVDDAPTITRLLRDERVATVITDAPARALAIREGLLGGTGAVDGVRLLRAAATMR